MLTSDIYSNSVQSRPAWLSLLGAGLRRLLHGQQGGQGNVPALHTAQEVAYLACAEDHQDLERRLAVLANRHQTALFHLDSWPR